MSNLDQKKLSDLEDQIKRLEREKRRLQRTSKRQETQLQQLDKMSSANEKININLYKELESLSRELEANNRELEIEAALERVRARAMAMHQSSDLANAIAVVFKELDKLGIATIRCGITIIDANNRTMDTWIATTTEKGQEVQVPGLLPIDGNPTLEKVFDTWKQGAPFMSYELEGDALQRYYKTIVSDLPLPEREAYHQKQVVSLFFFLEGGLYSYTAEPLSDEASQIFQRFTRVFSMTYRRFLDLKQAEEQAREAQIEAALERVRARSMAMHNSDELREVVVVLFEQLKQVGLDVRECEIIIFDKKTMGMELWGSGFSETRLHDSYRIPFLDHPIYKNRIKAWKQGVPYRVVELAGGEKRSFDRLYFEETDFKNLPAKTKAAIRAVDRFAVSEAFTKHGLLETIGDEPLPDDQAVILQRFAKVFEQTYTRFLDLKKAEEQAREAQIEAALERVRARAMAMHRSEELAEASTVLFEQLQHLDIHPKRCVFVIADEEKKSLEMWGTASDGQNLTTYKLGTLSIKKHPVFRKAWDAWQAKKPGVLFAVKGQSLAKFYDVISDSLALPPVAGNKARIESSGEHHYNAIFKHGTIAAIFSAPPEETVQVLLQRFAKVFEQTYTRFLDLKQAEEQAREAQIEAALERIRNRTLMMKDSSELNEAVAVFFQQFKSLDLLPAGARTYFCHIDTGTHTAQVWMTHADGTVMNGSHFTPLNQSASLKRFYEAWKNQEPINVRDYSGKALLEYLQFVSTLPHVKTDKDYKRLFKSPPERIVMTDANFLQGNIGIMTFEPLSEEALNILVRFAKVFEFTYTRFLDLKQAEEQAREAQIEAALERVRARAMAMHNSDELLQVVHLLFDQLENLSLSMDSSFINEFIDDSDDLHVWVAAGGQTYSERVHIPYFKHPYFASFRKARVEGTAFFTNNFSKRQKDAWFTHYFERSSHKTVPQKRKEYIFSCAGMTISTALTKNTAITIGRYSATPFTEEENNILKRVAQVFEQSYTRFLDLKKAEAQAREALIEAALEKVRSRSLAMHTTDELGDVVTVIVEKLQDLGVVLDANGVVLCTYFKDSRDVLHWIVSPDYSMAGSYLLPYFDHPIFNAAWESKLSGAEYWSKAFSVEEKNSFFEYAFEHSDYKHFPDDFKEWVFQNDKHSLSFAWSENSAILIPSHTGVVPSEEDIEILKRFAKVFEQAYVRFMDLQKAEAQAREAQIEAALERVRARTMAMQKSQELQETSLVLFQQFRELGAPAEQLSIGVINEEEKTLEVSATLHGRKLEQTYNIKVDEQAVVRKIYQAWKARGKSTVIEISGQELHDYNKWRNSLAKTKVFSTEDKAPSRWIINMAFFSRGVLSFSTHEAVPAETIRLLERFAGVFDLTYTRFLDLQQAEARAREAEQEASLDRVRAEIASMRTADDLQRITPLIWRELTTLGVPFFRCGVFIIDEASEKAHVYLSNPKGKSLAVMHMDFDSSSLVTQTVEHWRQKQIYREEWDQKQFTAWTQSLVEQGFIKNPKKYQAGEEAPEKLVLQFVPFAQGMLYVGSAVPLSDEEIEVTQALADAFAVAYARYEDFTQLESANQRKADELEEARQLQLAMLPRSIPKLPDLEIAAYMQTATEVGGDYYDFDVDPYGTLTVAIGDATGHGLKAGTIVASTKSLFKALAHEPYPAEVLKKISLALKSMGFTRMFMGMAVAKLSNHRLTISAGGMPLALVNRIETGKTEQVVLKAPPLGSFPNFQYEQKVVALKPGDTVLFLSDGLEETFNNREQMLGERRVRKLFREVANEKPQKIIKHLVKTAKSWADGQVQRDDMTILVIKMK